MTPRRKIALSFATSVALAAPLGVVPPASAEVPQACAAYSSALNSDPALRFMTDPDFEGNRPIRTPFSSLNSLARGVLGYDISLNGLPRKDQFPSDDGGSFAVHNPSAFWPHLEIVSDPTRPLTVRLGYTPGASHMNCAAALSSLGIGQPSTVRLTHPVLEIATVGSTSQYVQTVKGKSVFDLRGVFTLLSRDVPSLSFRPAGGEVSAVLSPDSTSMSLTFPLDSASADPSNPGSFYFVRLTADDLGTSVPLPVFVKNPYFQGKLRNTSGAGAGGSSDPSSLLASIGLPLVVLGVVSVLLGNPQVQGALRDQLTQAGLGDLADRLNDFQSSHQN